MKISNTNYEQSLEDAISRLNNDYKKVLTSREYLLGRKIYRLYLMIKKRRFKEFVHIIYKYLVSSKEIKLNEKGTRWLTYNEKADISQRIVIYTCLVGGYEDLEEPLYNPPNIDYIAYTDFEISKNSLWKKVNIDSISKIRNLDNQRKNRYIKLHPHELFKDYKYSIYIDANIKIMGNLSKYVRCIGDNVPIAVNWHPTRDCIFSEGEACCLEKRDKPELIKRQLEYYKKKGMPKEFGLIEGGMLIREHNNINCISLMNAWWKELCRWSRRDQLSFPFVLWKMGYSMHDIGFISENIRYIDEILLLPHGGLEIK